MPDDADQLLQAVIGGSVAARAELAARAGGSTSAALLAAALLSDAPADLLARAGRHATTTHDRQLVAIAAAHVDGDSDLVDALVHDHLVDHPDNVLAAWIAAEHTRPSRPHP